MHLCITTVGANKISLGIIVEPLIKRLGWRGATICGSVLSAFGLCISALSNSVYVLYFTYGILSGNYIHLAQNV